MTVLQEAVQTLAEAKADALQAQESLRDATERTDLALNLARDIGARRTSEQLRQVQAQMRSANEQTAAVISGLNRAHVITRSLTGSIWKGPRPCGSEVSDLLSVRSSGADRAHRRRQCGAGTAPALVRLLDRPRLPQFALSRAGTEHDADLRRVPVGRRRDPRTGPVGPVADDALPRGG